MINEKKNVYVYTRVSTSMQVDGYSLEAQKSRIRKFAELYDYNIVAEYEDAGKSGKTIEGRAEFTKMLEDIISNKDDVKFVLVYKLSRFGRNVADILNSLEIMQDNDVNLISVEDGIDSSKETGKLVITILSAVSEIERENILAQTMEGRKQKAREGKWNGGFAHYGYKLVEGKLEICEEEAKAIKIIFDKYTNTEIGANGVAKYLINHGIRKIPRQNGKSPTFSPQLIRSILDNPIYCGKIAFGRRKKEKIKGTKNEYHNVKQNDYMVFDGVHEAIIDIETWEKTQEKRKKQFKKYEHTNKGKNQKTHLLTGLIKCPLCNANMYSNKSKKWKADGKEKHYYYYYCKHRRLINDKPCTFNKQLKEDLLDGAVFEVINKLVSNPKFANHMKDKINIKIDTSEIEKEIKAIQEQLTQYIGVKRTIENQMDNLDINDKLYPKKLQDLENRLNKMYDNIYCVEENLKECRARKRNIEEKNVTTENVYKILTNFDKLYRVMEDIDKKKFLKILVDEIHIHDEKQGNGQLLKTIVFNVPIVSEKINISLDNGSRVECIVLMSRK